MKKFLIVTALFCLPYVLSSPVQAAVFTDVTPGSELAEAVDFLQQVGAVDQRPYFKGEDSMTRVAYLKMLLAPISLHEADVVMLGTTELLFTDIEAGAWYVPTLQKAVIMGVIANEEVAFIPEGLITRREALPWALDAYGVARGYDPLDISGVFRDVLPTSTHRSLVSRVWKLGVMDGVSAGVFGLHHVVSRADGAVLVYRLQSVERGGGGITIEVTGSSGMEGFDEELFRTVRQYIDEVYYFSEDIDPQALSYGAIRGMVEGLGDPYSQFMPPEEAEMFETALESEVEGIGTYVVEDPMGLRIDGVIPNTPAEAAGLRAGDIIIRVEGEDIGGVSAYHAISMIRGPRGTAVTLEVWRDGVRLPFTVVRDAFAVTSIVQEEEDGYYILRVRDFRENTGAEFASYVEDIGVKRPRAVVLDLRDNRGGYLAGSVELLRHFFKADVQLLSVDYGDGGGLLDYSTTEDGTLHAVPLVVFINGETASAAEIVAGTLQDYGRAVLIGEVTYGKGTVQGVIAFDDASVLKLTMAKWLTGKGRWVTSWEEEGEEYRGLQPDVLVERETLEEVGNELRDRDTVLQEQFETDLMEALQQAVL